VASVGVVVEALDEIALAFYFIMSSTAERSFRQALLAMATIERAFKTTGGDEGTTGGSGLRRRRRRRQDLCRRPCESGIARAAAPEVLNDDQLRSRLRIAATSPLGC